MERASGAGTEGVATAAAAAKAGTTEEPAATAVPGAAKERTAAGRRRAASRRDGSGSAVVPTRSRGEEEYARRRGEIGRRRQRVAELQAELARLKAALGGFEAACHARVGDLLAELRRLADAAADYERRLQRLRADDEGTDDPEPPPFARPTETAAEAGHDGPSASGDPGGRGAARAAASARAALRRLPAAQLAEAKRLYLDLAKRCHPDRATDDADRHRRQELMLRINDAWRHRDLAALHALRRETEGADPGFAQRPLGERLAWAAAELARLDDLLVDLRAEIILLRGGETHRLWRRHEAGEPVIDKIESDLEKRLAKEGRRLDALIASYRRRLDERRRARRLATSPVPAAD